MNANNATKKNKINDLYENVGYFSSYGGSVLSFLFITFFVFFIWAYYTTMQTVDAVKQDWVNQRCNPKVIPFAGWINKPENDGKTPLEFTSENFQFCTQSILTSMMGTVLSPFNALLGQLTSVFTDLNAATDQSRGIMSKLRSNIADITQNIMNRILGVMIPMQRMFMAFTDSLAKTQAIMTSGLYTMLGSYYTLQSLMGAILEMIIKMLVSLAVVIVGLWIVPFTWPAAAVSTAVFLSISIPLSIIALFMTEVLHIHSAGIPKLHSCFDKDTPIQMQDGSFRPIALVKTGDVLFRGETVTATMRLLREQSAEKKEDMYWIPTNKYSPWTKGVVVSGTHPVQKPASTTWFFQTPYMWVWAKDHPDAVLIDDYAEPVIYCFNTTSKLIHAGGHVFSDWDELFDHRLDHVLSTPIGSMHPEATGETIRTPDRIFEHCETAFLPDVRVPVISKDKENDKSTNKLNLKRISDVALGDYIIKGGTVYGTVDVLNVDEVAKPEKHLLTTLQQFSVMYAATSKKMGPSKVGRKTVVRDYNYNIDGLLFLKK